MEGFYQTNPELENQLSHPSEDQQPGHPQPNVLAMQDASLPPQLQQQLQQPQPTLPNHMISNQTVIPGSQMDGVMREGHNDMQRRRSMPQAYGTALPPTTQVPPPRRMSTIGPPRDMMGFDTGAAGFGSYQFNPDMPPPFGVQDQMGGYVTDAGSFSGIPQDIMGTMMPSQFASMDMGGITAEPSAIDLFPGTSVSAPDLTASTIAGQLDTSQLAPGGDGFVLAGNPTGGPLGRRSNSNHKGMAMVHDENMINAPPSTIRIPQR